VEIDIGSGLTVVVDDNKPGNLEFVKSVEASGAHILHLAETYFDSTAGDHGKVPKVFR
jgi:hypothetical protein